MLVIELIRLQVYTLGCKSKCSDQIFKFSIVLNLYHKTKINLILTGN